MKFIAVIKFANNQKSIGGNKAGAEIDRFIIESSSIRDAEEKIEALGDRFGYDLDQAANKMRLDYELIAI